MEVKEAQELDLKLIEVFERVCRENNIWYTLTSGSMLGAIRHKGFIPWDSDIDVFVKISDVKRLRKALLESIPKEMKLCMWDKEPGYPLNFDRLAIRDIPHYEVHLDIHTLVGAPAKEKEQIRFTKLCFCSSKFLKCKYVDTKYSKPSYVKKIKFVRLFAKLIPDALINKWYNYLDKKYDFNKAEYVYTVASEYGIKECFPKELILNTKAAPFEHLMLQIPVRYHDYLSRVYGDYMTPVRDGYKLLK